MNSHVAGGHHNPYKMKNHWECTFLKHCPHVNTKWALTLIRLMLEKLPRTGGCPVRTPFEKESFRERICSKIMFS